MRPGDFSPGNLWINARRDPANLPSGFNEAGGFLPRKLMRTRTSPEIAARSARFNEAGGFLPRKLAAAGLTLALILCFNEAGGFLPRKRGGGTRTRNVRGMLQ